MVLRWRVPLCFTDQFIIRPLVLSTQNNVSLISLYVCLSVCISACRFSLCLSLVDCDTLGENSEVAVERILCPFSPIDYWHAASHINFFLHYWNTIRCGKCKTSKPSCHPLHLLICHVRLALRKKWKAVSVGEQFYTQFFAFRVESTAAWNGKHTIAHNVNVMWLNVLKPVLFYQELPDWATTSVCTNLQKRLFQLVLLHIVIRQWQHHPQILQFPPHYQLHQLWINFLNFWFRQGFKRGLLRLSNFHK